MHNNEMVDMENDSMLALIDTDGRPIEVGADEGLMLVRCTKEGMIVPHVLRTAIFTSGRLEAGFMIMCNALEAAHAAAHRRRINEEREAARLLRETQHVD